MALETATYVNDLVITNPTSSDAKSQGDDHLRLLKNVLKETLNGFTGAILVTATDSGTAGAHVLTPTTALVGYTAFLMLLYRPANAGTGALTVNVSGLGAKSVKTLSGADPTTGDILANQPILLVYDGTNFVLLAGTESLGKTGNQTLTGTLAITSNATVGGTFASTGATTLPTATTIGTTTATELGYVHGVTSAIQTQIATLGVIAGQVWTGAQDFTGATITVPTQALSDSSTKAASTAFAAGLAFSAALPATGGVPDGYVVGRAASLTAWIPGPNVTRSARTSNTILVAADQGKLIDFTSGTFTQTLTAAATLGSGWYVWAKNSGTGVATFDPNAAELMGGATTADLNPGDEWLIQCTGAAFTMLRLAGMNKQIYTSGSGNFTVPGGVYRLWVESWGGGGGVNNTAAGFGGGGGGYSAGWVNTTPAATIAYAVGAAGSAGSGGNTSFGALTANGGGGGGANGAGGTASGGDINIAGSPGGGFASLAVGGASMKGAAPTVANATAPGIQPGGGGATCNSSGAAVGGAGMIIVYWV